METAFRRLTAYRVSVELADELHSVVGRWSSLDQWSLGVQLLRSIESVGANIAEAAGRERPLDKRRFLVIARGSLYETEHWLARAEARGLIDTTFSQRLTEANRALNGLLRRRS